MKPTPEKNRLAEYLTFRLEDEDYGVDILRVMEIRGWEAVTRIPNAPAYVKGVLNLRGAIVPIFDMRQRLEMALKAYCKNTVVIVLKVIGMVNERHIGIVVDEVSDVLEIAPEQVRNAPQIGGGMPTEFITGVVDAAGKMVMLLDVDKLLNQGLESQINREDAAKAGIEIAGESS
jgi:purine-binding chemotaxis protein CheW